MVSTIESFRGLSGYLKIYVDYFLNLDGLSNIIIKIVSEYGQEIPQSQTADKPVSPRGRATQQSRDTRTIN